MPVSCRFDSPVGSLFLVSDGQALSEIHFEDEACVPSVLERCLEGDDPVLNLSKRWLETYFNGRDPGARPPLHPVGTAFRMAVWARLLDIPFGRTATYGGIASKIAAERGLAAMSARAVGGAVGANPIPVIIPCHRVVGADGSLTGFTGGMWRKVLLLKLEGVLLGGK